MSKNRFCNEVALCRMSNGAVARFMEARRVGTPPRESFSVYGTEGAFETDFGGSRWITKSGVTPVDTTRFREPIPEELKQDLGGHGGSHAYLVHEFVDSLARQRTPRINVWEAVRYMAPGIVAHKSVLRGGEPMEVPDWGDPPP